MKEIKLKARSEGISTMTMQRVVKTCTRCKNILMRSAFRKRMVTNKRTGNLWIGPHPMCKECERQYNYSRRYGKPLSNETRDIIQEQYNTAVESITEKLENDVYARPVKVCPKCGNQAATEGDLERVFGWRDVRGKRLTQSYCRECRSNKKRVQTA